jgi:dephospho-CoA kinase
MRLVVLTGASGSGKTAIAKAIKTRYPDLAKVFCFDEIGVPSLEEITAGWGSGEAWQRAMTVDWMVRIAAADSQDRPVLFEGQMRLVFVQEGLRAAGIADARVILVDCDDATRAQRLTTLRDSPELANPTMMNWAAYLRREAQLARCERLDTSVVSLDAAIEYVRSALAGDPRPSAKRPVG